MKYKYAVFDWDGTLADTYPVIAAAYNYTFDKMGLPQIAYDEMKRMTSALQNKDTLGYIFKQRKDEAAGYFYEYIEKFHADRLAPIPEAKKLLDFCLDQKMKCFLVTNKQTRFVRKELEKLGFAKCFSKVVAAGEYAEDKPHPSVCRAVFDNYLPPAGEIVVIGDGEADVKTAAAYEHDGEKAKCILYDPKHKYRGLEPDHKVERLMEAAAILEKK